MKKKLQKLQDKKAEIREKRLAKKQEAENPSIPRITNENVAEHREDILAGARKYIYPLQHSKHKIVIWSVGLLITALIVFSVVSVLLLYRLETTSGFMYQVTRVIPFPIARTEGTFVAYENYLFELNHYIHYYENQQELSFETEAGKQQLASYKERAINKVVNDAYVKIIAQEQGIAVSELEVDEQIRIAREQNRLGSSEDIFEDVLRDFWGWSIDDFKRSLRSELLAQKVIVELDTDARDRATSALAELESGSSFEDVAEKYSDDEPTKNDGGEFGYVNKSNRNVSPQTVDTLFGLEEGQYSDIEVVPYGTGYALAIIKNIERDDNEVRGAHIIIRLKNIDEVLNDRKESQPYRLYMNPAD